MGMDEKVLMTLSAFRKHAELQGQYIEFHRCDGGEAGLYQFVTTVGPGPGDTRSVCLSFYIRGTDNNSLVLDLWKGMSYVRNSYLQHLIGSVVEDIGPVIPLMDG